MREKLNARCGRFLQRLGSSLLLDQLQLFLQRRQALHDFIYAHAHISDSFNLQLEIGRKRLRVEEYKLGVSED